LKLNELLSGDELFEERAKDKFAVSKVVESKRYNKGPFDQLLGTHTYNANWLFPIRCV